MTNRTEPLTLQGPHGPIAASLVRPHGAGPFPAVLLLHEGIGLSGHLLGLAERLAEAGYVSLVPDLYTRDSARKALSEAEVIRFLPLARAAQRGALLAALPDEAQDSARRVVAWFDGRDSSTYLPDALAAASFLRRHRAVRSDAVASIGFSQGGGLSAQLSTSDAGLAAGVIFYGSGPALEQAAQVRYPLLGHYAEHDPSITPQAPALAERLRAIGKQFTTFVYFATEHGFFNPARPSFRREAAELAYERTLHFLVEHLSDQPSRSNAQSASI
ncbi:MAG TPA: dienelactone hydrolase family protein [Polyangiales bacterium]